LNRCGNRGYSMIFLNPSFPNLDFNATFMRGLMGLVNSDYRAGMESNGIVDFVESPFEFESPLLDLFKKRQLRNAKFRRENAFGCDFP